MLYEIKDAKDKRLRREKEWGFIVYHHTSVGDRIKISDSLWAQLSNNITEYLAKADQVYVSAHYSIHRDGKIVQLVDPDHYEAFHAGASECWHPNIRTMMSDLNRYAIGIEIIGDGNRFEYSNEQYKALIELSRYLLNKYPSIQPHGLVGHDQVCKPIGRKIDPGKLFDWKRLFKGIYS